MDTLFLIDLRGHPVRLQQQLPIQSQSILNIDTWGYTWGYYLYDETTQYSWQQQQHDPQQPQNEKDRILEMGKSICHNDEERAKHIFGIHERQKVFIQHTHVCVHVLVCVFVHTCVFVCVCICTGMCVCPYVYICTYMYLWVCVCVCLSLCVRIRICIYVRTCIFVCVCVCVFVQTCVFVCVYVYVFVHTCVFVYT